MDINRNILERFSIPAEGPCKLTSITDGGSIDKAFTVARAHFEKQISDEKKLIEQDNLSPFRQAEITNSRQAIIDQAEAKLFKIDTTEKDITDLAQEINKVKDSKSEIEVQITVLNLNISDADTSIKKYQIKEESLKSKLELLGEKPAIYLRPSFHMLLDFVFGLGRLLSFLAEKKLLAKHAEEKNSIETQIKTLENAINKNSEIKKTWEVEKSSLESNLITANQQLMGLENAIHEVDKDKIFLSFQIAQKLNKLINPGSQDSCFYKIGQETISSKEEQIFEGKEISNIILESEKNLEIANSNENQEIIKQAKQDLINNDCKSTAIKAVLCWNAILTSISTLDPNLSKLDRYHLISFLGTADRLAQNDELMKKCALQEIAQTHNADEPTVITKEGEDIHIRSKFSLEAEGSDRSDHTMEINLNKKTYNIFETTIKQSH